VGQRLVAALIRRGDGCKTCAVASPAAIPRPEAVGGTPAKSLEAYQHAAINMSAFGSRRVAEDN
jgi:hypothetical protein